MDLVRLGSAVRAVRLRARLRQADVAERAGVSQATVSRLERGHAGTLPLATIERIAGALEVRIDIVPRWRGGHLDRMLAAGHARLGDEAIRMLRRWPGWSVVPEVSFSRWGERGVIDLLAWNADAQAVLIVELKTQLVDPQELLGTLDRKRRLAREIAADHGWNAMAASAWVLMSDTRTNRRRVDDLEALLRAALPSGGRELQAWLRRPVGAVAGLSFLSISHPRTGRQSATGVERVRRPSGGRERRERTRERAPPYVGATCATAVDRSTSALGECRQLPVGDPSA